MDDTISQIEGIMMGRTHVNLTEIETEIIYLKANAEIIDEIVNYEVFDLLGEDPNSEVSFRTMTHQRYFNIVLADFLSKSDPRVVGQDRSYLEAILVICESPRFDQHQSITNLQLAASRFQQWLDRQVVIESWMPSLNKTAPLSLKRREFLKICGNISKHNFSRLGRVGEELSNILNRGGVQTDMHRALIVLHEFYEHFHAHILNHHGSTIAQHLNDIRWGIHEYLQPEFARSIRRMGGDSIEYEYTFPEGVVNEFARICYWDLMNAVRSVPCVRRFTASRLLQSRY